MGFWASRAHNLLLCQRVKHHSAISYLCLLSPICAQESKAQLA